MTVNKMGKRIPYYQCLIVFIIMSASLLFSILLLKKPIYLGLIIGIIIAAIVSIINGFKLTEVLIMMYKGLSKNFLILIILSIIGMLIGVWKAGGIIPTMLYYSFGIINKNVFLLSSFIISGTIGLIMGTSSGTVGAVGIVLIGLGNAMGFPPGVIAGAVVSGAFIGDRSSPISGVLNVVASLTDTKAHELFKYLWRTMIYGIVFASLFYFAMGLLVKGGSSGLDASESYKYLIKELFCITPWLLLPPILLICFPIFKTPTVYALLITLILSCALALFCQGITYTELSRIIIFGFNPKVQESYKAVLAGGGLVSLKTMLLVLICATSLNGIFEGTKMIITIVEPVLNKIESSRGLQLFTILFSIGSAIFLCNQLMSIIVPAGVLKDKYNEIGIDNKTFAGVLSDSGVMTSSLIPWNVAALTPAAIMGVSVLSFAPYAFLGYAMPVISLINILIMTKKTNIISLEENI